MSEQIFFQLAAILVIAFLVSYVIRLLKQPLIMGYIITGIIVSPFLIKFGATAEVIDLFSKIGIAFLLFIVGLHLNPKVIKEIGAHSLFIGLLQMIVIFGITFFIFFNLLNFDLISSFYVGIALAFSSTIIVMKLLSDKKHLDSLYGKLSIGILIIQDLVAVAVLIFISSTTGEGNFGALALKTLLIGGGLFGVLFLIGFFVLPKITKTVARSQELLFLFSVCWCFLVAALFAIFGFSLEVGALIAGVILSVTPYSTEISSKIRPLRDFFLIIFFIILGLNLDISNIKEIVIYALILSAIALTLKPIVLMTFMALFKYTKRTNFLVGTTLAQISEFSLIILILGVSLGHVSSEILNILTLTLVLTILGSTYMVIFSKTLYEKMFRFVSIFESKKIKGDIKHLNKEYSAILFGYNRTGFDILKSLTKLKKPYLVVDFNPDTINVLNKFRVPSLYGDADDPELIAGLRLEKIDLAISTIPTYDSNFLLIESIKSVNPNAIIITRANTINEALELYKKGADYVLTPSFLSGEHLSRMINNIKISKKGYEKEKQKHLKRLSEISKKNNGFSNQYNGRYYS